MTFRDECDLLPPVYAPRRGVPETEVASVSEAHARELHALLGRAVRLLRRSTDLWDRTADLIKEECWRGGHELPFLISDEEVFLASIDAKFLDRSPPKVE